MFSVMKAAALCLHVFVLLFNVLRLNGANVTGHAETGWSYDKDMENGPDHWMKYFPQCGGTQQSPIDIPSTAAVVNHGLASFIFDQKIDVGRSFIVEKNDHAVEIIVQDDIYIKGGGLNHTYKTKQLHFHWGNDNSYGSEHSLDGKFFPVELHIVNWNSDKYTSFDEAKTQPDGLAVIAIWFTISQDNNTLLDDVINAVQDLILQGQSRKPIPAFPLYELLPARSHRYFRYQGSLTTPGCFESVTWTVFEQAQTISLRQLSVFRQVFKHGGDTGHIDFLTHALQHQMNTVPLPHQLEQGQGQQQTMLHENLWGFPHGRQRGQGSRQQLEISNGKSGWVPHARHREQLSFPHEESNNSELIKSSHALHRDQESLRRKENNNGRQRGQEGQYPSRQQFMGNSLSELFGKEHQRGHPNGRYRFRRQTGTDIAVTRTLIPINNSRPPQPLNGRIVYRNI